jgi:hypothetical protein
MSLDAIKAAQAAKAAKEAEGTGATIAAAKVLVAHEEALAKGIPVAKALRLKRLILKDGTKVEQTEEGYFIALNKEIAEHLDYFDKQGLVEIVTPENK